MFLLTTKVGCKYLTDILWQDKILTKTEKLIIEKILRDYPQLDESDPQKKELKKVVGRALDILKTEELEVIKIKYFDRSEPSDEKVLINNPYSNSSYYRIKKSALKKIAIALNII
jgi:hypothetical protein